MRCTKKLILASLIFACWSGLTQDSNALYHTRFQRLDSSHGLIQNLVFDMAMDQRGVLWIATQAGLSRYDGNKFTNYAPDSANPHALKHGWLSDLALGPDDELWVASRFGLYRHEADQDHFEGYFASEQPGSLSNNHVLSLAFDQDGRLWAGTWDGLNLLEEKEFRKWRKGEPPSGDLPLDPIFTMSAIKDAIWLGTVEGKVIRWDPRTETGVEIPVDHPKAGIVHFISQDLEGRIWKGSRYGGLQYFDEDSGRFRRICLPGDLESLCVDASAFAVDPNSGFWVGGRGYLVHLIPDLTGGKHQYRLITSSSDPTGLNQDWVRTLLMDPGGVLWVGGPAIQKLPALTRAFNYVKPGTGNNLAGENIWSFYEDSHDTLWLGTSDGLGRLDKNSGEFRNYLPNPQDPNAIYFRLITDVFEDSKGRLWVVSFDNGISLYIPEKDHFKNYVYEPEGGGTDEMLRVGMEDHNQNLWVGSTRFGPAQLNPDTGEFKNFRLNPEKEEDSAVITLVEDRDGVIWVGSIKEGLFRYQADTGQFDQFSHSLHDPHSLSGNQVMAILEDSQGRFWVGSDSGLDLFDRTTGKSQHFRTQEGLANNNIFTILEDDQGRLWMGTVGGLTCFDVERKTFHNYGFEDGLQGEYNNNAALKLKDGRLIFGGVLGYNIFNPNKIQYSTHVPQTILTGFFLYNRKMEPSPQGPLTHALDRMDQMVLEHDHDIITFEFATLNYENLQKNRNIYMMEQQDKDWTETLPGRHDATYTDLSPGRYRFRVKGAGANGVWGEEASIQIYVKPPIWRTWWAYGLYTLLVLGMAAGYLQRQKKKLAIERAINERLMRADKMKDAFLEHMEEAHRAGRAEIAGNVLHDMGNTINSIQTSAHLILGKIAETRLTDAVGRLSQLFHEHRTDLPQFLAKDANHKKVVAMLDNLHQKMKAAIVLVDEEGRRLETQLEKTRAALKEQQAHVGSSTRYMSVCDLRTLVEEAAAMQEKSMAEAGIDLNLRLPPQPVEARVDRSRFSRMLYYILNNAREVLVDQEGKRTVQIQLTRENQRVVTTIWDNGPGASQETLDKVFLQDFSTKEGHRGYGLHYCCNAAKQMKMDIAVEAGPEGGVCVRLVFPEPESDNP